MSSGTPFRREFVLAFEDGRIVLDWGDEMFQDLETGEFFHCPHCEISHQVDDNELELLKRAGQVDHFNKQQVFFVNLPDRPIKTIE
jgi:hypothetical protein